MQRRTATLALLVCALAPRTARADIAPAVAWGERSGAIAPEGSTRVRIDRAELDFAFTDRLDTAAITARYTMHGEAEGAESLEVAFVFVHGERRDTDLEATVEVDGERIGTRTQSDAEVLAPRLNTWVAEHEAVDRALRAATGMDDPPDRRTDLVRAVTAAGGRCRGECADLVAWYRELDAEDDAPPAKRRTDQRIVAAAREAIPSEVADLAGTWAAPTEARLDRLVFLVDFAPGETHAVTLRYDQQASLVQIPHVNPTFRFNYQLSPAKRWAGFGPLDVTVHVPARTRFSSAAPFFHDGAVERARFAGLPSEDLRFETMSLDGLWFGMTEPKGYWALLVIAVAAAALGVGAATGRLWTERPSWQRALLRIVAAGPLAAVGGFAVLVLLAAAFPVHALGYGYGSLVGGLGLIAVAIPAGAAASGIAAMGRRRG